MRDEALRVIELRDAKATGDLEASIQAHTQWTANGFRLVAGADAKPGSEVAPYAFWVDQPTRPHWVPLERNADGHLTPKVLERWARAKFGATGEQKTAIAWGAAHSIARRGTSGVRFVAAMEREIEGTVVDRLEDAMLEEWNDSD